ncbi:MAG: peptidoglycan DD-metalloendopeptidase family protein [Acidimicrobiia bacterium]|nr:peptidoglycan DD-metalloendopeptidase family protein [Acidimicrobiia bacterium]
MRTARTRLMVFTLAMAMLSASPIGAGAQSRESADQAKAEAEAALQELREANDAVEAALAEYHVLEDEMESLTWKVTQLTDRIKDYEGEVRELRTRAEDLVAGAYMAGGTDLVEIALEVDSIQDLLAGQVLLDRAADNDLVSVTRLDAVRREMNRLKDDLDVDQARVVELRAAAEANVINLDELQRAAADAFRQAEDKAKDELAKYLAEKRRREIEEAAKSRGAAAGLPPESTPWFTCPVPNGNFINDWGFARSGGRTHKGTDVFAPRGSKLLAPDSGRVSLSSNSLGGIVIYLTGDNGVSFYLAHLDGYAAGLSSGDRVSNGEVIGYIGNTGNAVGTSPHLHIQLRPSNGSWVNPFPTLRHYC